MSDSSAVAKKIELGVSLEVENAPPGAEISKVQRHLIWRNTGGGRGVAGGRGARLLAREVVGG